MAASSQIAHAAPPLTLFSGSFQLGSSASELLGAKARAETIFKSQLRITTELKNSNIESGFIVNTLYILDEGTDCNIVLSNSTKDTHRGAGTSVGILAISWSLGGP